MSWRRCCALVGAWLAIGVPGTPLHAGGLMADRPSYFEEHPSARIPKGLLPASTACRIWYPERPARLQPAPMRCDLASGRVEPTGWLIAPGARPGELHVTVFDDWHPGRVAGTATFDARTGELLRGTHRGP